ncbi:MAG: hypothetical protein SNG35_03575 [Rikenellaceae bacterium]
MAELITIKRSATRYRVYLFGIKIFSSSPTRSKDLLYLNFIHRRYRAIERTLAKRGGRERVKVAFLVSISSMFPSRPLFDAMVDDSNFEATILIIPDLRFGLERAKKIQEQSVAELSVYGKSVHVVPIDAEEDDLCLKGVADIIFTPWMYDISHPKYFYVNFLEQGILPALIYYGVFNTRFDVQSASTLEYSLFWRIFVENQLTVDEYREHQMIEGRNVVLSGYAKMDPLAAFESKSDRRRIIIAPHHSVQGGFNQVLSLSNFYTYADLFLKLPDLYPDIDFVFRPHPALFICLEREEFWGRERVESYICEMKSKRNVIYSEGGDYLQEFALSDGIIEDCSSFLTEYLYTMKPHCYMLKSREDIEANLTKLGRGSIEQCYIAYSEEDIVRFIEDVIVGGVDPMRVQRERFAKDVVMHNYPRAAEEIKGYLYNLFFK